MKLKINSRHASILKYEFIIVFLFKYVQKIMSSIKKEMYQFDIDPFWTTKKVIEKKIHRISIITRKNTFDPKLRIRYVICQNNARDI